MNGTDDDRIRHLLRSAMTPVEDTEGAHRRILDRSDATARRRRVVQVPAIAGAAVGLVAVVGTLVWLTIPAGDRSPVIGPEPETTQPSPTSTPRATAGPCDGIEVRAATSEYLATWTAADASLHDDICVVAGLHGPVPVFDTATLGTEQRLHPGDLPADADPPEDRPGFRERADGYPLVHLGRLEETHVFLEWNIDLAVGPLACVDGVCAPGEHPGERHGVYGIGHGSGMTTMTVWVPPAAAVVALEIDGEPILWQRPVALIAELHVRGAGPVIGRSWEVRVLDRTGAEIDRYSGVFDG